LLPIPREPWVRLSDVWSPLALQRAAVAVLALIAFRLSAGSLLTVGMERVEARFLAFHLMHGLLLGAGLAWCRGERTALRWTLWLVLGLLGGLMAEALEVWYTYRHLMSTLTFYAWQWFELPSTPALIYQILQGLRLVGALFPLVFMYFWVEQRNARQFLALGFLLLALGARVFVRGAYLAWPGLLTSETWPVLALYAVSALAIFYGLGPRTLDGPRSE
jgi:hypothetical protein